jgi:hypothetical protein
VNPADWITPVAQYGWLGVLVVVLVSGWREDWVWGKVFRREVAHNEKLVAQRDEAISLAAKLTEIVEAGRRGQYRSSQ